MASGFILTLHFNKLFCCNDIVILQKIREFTKGMLKRPAAYVNKVLHSYACLNCITVLFNHLYCCVLPYVYLITRVNLEL